MTVTDADATPDPIDPEVEPEADDDDDEDAPRRRTALFVSLAVAVVLVAFVAVLATRDTATDRVADSPLLDKPAPALVGQTLDGGSFNIDDYAGDRWVVVNFFAEWCAPCRQEHPQLLSFDETHSRLGDAALVSVVFNDDTADVQEYFAENGGDWPVVGDDEFQISNDWGVAGVPETYIVAPSGKVVAKLIGGVTQRGLEQVMAQEAAEIRDAADDAGSGS